MSHIQDYVTRDSTLAIIFLQFPPADTVYLDMIERNGRKTLTTVQGLPKKFDQKKILKVIKKKFACNGTIVNDTEMGEVIQLQGDQRKDVQEFLVDKKEGLGLDAKTIKVSLYLPLPLFFYGRCQIGFHRLTWLL